MSVDDLFTLQEFQFNFVTIIPNPPSFLVQSEK